MLGIGVGIAAIIALKGIMTGFGGGFTELALGSGMDLMAEEADVSDTGYSSIDERVGAKLAALPDVAGVAGIGFAYVSTEETPLLFMLGYNRANCNPPLQGWESHWRPTGRFSGRQLAEDEPRGGRYRAGSR
jgi:hypothetical protein